MAEVYNKLRYILNVQMVIISQLTKLRLTVKQFTAKWNIRIIIFKFRFENVSDLPVTPENFIRQEGSTGLEGHPGCFNNPLNSQDQLEICILYVIRCPSR